MFEGFAHVWTPIGRAREVRRGRAASFTVAGERVAVFRDRAGGVHALVDRCPHRGVRLSLGKVTPDGCLECPFHGWTYQGDGACVRIPFNDLDPEKRRHYDATALPVRDRGGLLWLYTAPGADAPTEPVVPETLVDPRFHTYFTTKLWHAHWTRAMENMLDAPHLPFVHRRTIGRGLAKKLAANPGAVMTVRTEETDSGLETHWDLDGEPSAGTLVWTRPNQMTLLIPIPGRRLDLMVWCAPVDAAHTRMIVAGARDFGRYNPVVKLLDQVNHLIIREDKAVVESSDPPVVPEPAAERSVASDRMTLAFRRWYLDHLAGGAWPVGDPAPTCYPGGRRRPCPTASSRSTSPTTPASASRAR